MKKFLLPILMILALLTSCSDTNTNPNSFVDLQNLDNNQSQNDNNLHEENADTQTISESDNLNLVFAHNSGKAVSVAGTDIGAYFVDYNNNGILAYFDEANKTSVPLCSRPECTHSDETCTAYVESGGYMIFTNANNENLFIIYFEQETSENVIAKTDKNGANREIIYSTTGVINQNFAIDKNNSLYFTEQNIIQESAHAYTNLVRVDTHTKDSTILVSFNGEESGQFASETAAYLLGAYENTLIILSNIYDDQTGNYSNSFIGYNLYHNDFEVLYEGEFNINSSDNIQSGLIGSTYVDEYFLYNIIPIDENFANVMQTDLKSDETINLGKINYYGLPRVNGMNSAYFDDDYMFLPSTNINDISDTTVYVFNLKTGEVKESKIPTTDGLGSKLIYDETSTHYIVYSGMLNATGTFYNTDGTTYESPIMAPEYAIIPKEDYINNISDNITSFYS